MESLTHRLDALRPKIEELMRIGGTPGLSLGVMHHGTQVYFASYGYRDVEHRLPPDDQTIPPVCSLTKAVTSAALGILVDEKKAAWDTLVKDALPSLDIHDETLQNQMTIADLLCHRSGMSWGDNLLIGTDNNIIVSGEDAMVYLNSQTRLLPFRGQFAYNNLAYELAGNVIESLSKESFFDFIQTRIFDPLGMTRTYLKTPSSELDNVGKCYNALDDGTSAPITCVKVGDDWLGAPHAGMWTCVKDLMKLYRAFMKAFNHQIVTGDTSTEGLPLRQVAQLMSANMFMDQPSRNEASYGLGWARLQLPGRMGQIGINPALMPHSLPACRQGCATSPCHFPPGKPAREACPAPSPSPCFSPTPKAPSSSRPTPWLSTTSRTGWGRWCSKSSSRSPPPSATTTSRRPKPRWPPISSGTPISCRSFRELERTGHRPGT
jgi:CubicO group peptidase (beta-lactamase class C family)